MNKNHEHIFLSKVKQLVRESGFNNKTKGNEKIASAVFLTSILFSFRKESRKKCIESINRNLFISSGIKLSRNNFWERLNRKSLNEKLISLYLKIIETKFKGLSNHSSLKKLGVKDIYAFDATTISLPERAVSIYQGTRKNKNHAAVK